VTRAVRPVRSFIVLLSKHVPSNIRKSEFGFPKKISRRQVRGKKGGNGDWLSRRPIASIR